MSDVIICKICEGKKVIKLEEKIEICPNCLGTGIIKEQSLTENKKLLLD